MATNNRKNVSAPKARKAKTAQATQHPAPEAQQNATTGTAIATATPPAQPVVTGTVDGPKRLPGQLKLVTEISAKLRKDVEEASHNTASLIVTSIEGLAKSVWDSMRSAAIALCKDANPQQNAAIFDLYWAGVVRELNAKGLKMPSTQSQYGGTIKMALRNGIAIGTGTSRDAVLKLIDEKAKADPANFKGGNGRKRGSGDNGTTTAGETVERERIKLIRESTNDVHKGIRESFAASEVKPDEAKKAATYAEEVARRAKLAADNGVVVAFWKALDKMSAQVLATLGVDEDEKPGASTQSDGQDAPRKVANG